MLNAKILAYVFFWPDQGPGVDEMVGVQGVRVAVLVFGCTVYAAPSYAYIDPGTGSIILQSILASVAVAMGVLRLYWYRLKAFFSDKSGSPDVQDSKDAEIQNET